MHIRTYEQIKRIQQHFFINYRRDLCIRVWLLFSKFFVYRVQRRKNKQLQRQYLRTRKAPLNCKVFENINFSSFPRVVHSSFLWSWPNSDSQNCADHAYVFYTSFRIRIRCCSSRKPTANGSCVVIHGMTLDTFTFMWNMYHIPHEREL